MSDDLVKRLRDDTRSAAHCALSEEAADEIERLRSAAVRDLASMAKAYWAYAMSDDIKDIKIGGISASEYIRGIKNGNIDPTYDHAIKALLWADDEIERLRSEIERLLGPYRLAAQAMIDESQHNAQLEGLAFGLEQRGEVSTAHVIRLALKRLERRG